MKLFMSKGLCRFLDYQIKLERLDDNRVKLIFCNLKKDRNGKEKYEDLEFIIPLKKNELLSYTEDYEVCTSRFRKTSKGYTFTPTTNKHSKVAYALLYYDKVFPSEVYMHISMKKYVKLIEQIQFYDIEPDWGQEIVKVYFVKINVLYGETIPFYFSYRDNFEYLRQHLIFCDDNWEHSIDTGNYCTKIKLDCSKRKEYISLSEL